jgi:diaminopimelate epimerase
MEVLHMSGAGNDFAVLDARHQALDFASLSQTLCKQTGADGFMAVDVSEIADFKLHFYNADGSRGEMCGNGARCICKYAFDHGIAGENMTVETDAGLIYGTRLEADRYRVKLNNPSIVDLHRRPDSAYVELGCPGVPHSITELPGLEWANKERLRPDFLRLRNAPEFPKGVNVNFYCFLTETTARILTYERGVEDFTLACGTGSASLAAVVWLEGKLPGNRLTVENMGGTLEVILGTDGDRITSIHLEGPAEVLDRFEI